MKITKKQKKTKEKTKESAVERVKRLKDSLLEIDLKDLEWQSTSNPETFYYGTRLEIEGIRVRVQIFIK